MLMAQWAKECCSLLDEFSQPEFVIIIAGNLFNPYPSISTGLKNLKILDKTKIGFIVP
jgi:hypothetical protein